MKHLQVNLALAGVCQLVWLAASGGAGAEIFKPTFSKETFGIYITIALFSGVLTAVFYTRSYLATRKKKK
jgi:hypothetical protein